MRHVIKPLILLLVIFSGCGAPRYETMLAEAQRFFVNNRYEQAEIELIKIIEANPKEPEPYYLLGLVHFAMEKYGESILNFDDAARLGMPKSAELLLNKGIALYNTRNLVEAEENIMNSIQARSSGIAQKYLGLIRYKRSDYNGSIAAFRKASSIQNDIISLTAFGMALYYEGMNAESLDIFIMAHNLAPDDEKITFKTANLLMLNGQNKEAVNMYSEIPSGSMYYLESIYNKAEACIRTGDFQNAAEQFKTYLKTRPDDYNALYNLSSALIKTGEYVEAADILMELIEDDNSTSGAVYNLGLANHKLGKYAESVYYFSLVVDQNPENINYRYAYGLALSEFGDIERASEQMETVLYYDPGNADAQEWLDQNPPIEPSPEDSIDKLMALSGLNKQIAEFPGMVRAGVEQTIQQGSTFPDAVFGEMLISIESAFQPSEILSTIGIEIKKNISESDVKNLLVWYESDLGRRITKAEENASTPAAYQEMIREAQSLLADEKRVKFAKMMESIINTTDMAMWVQENVIVSVITAISTIFFPDQSVNFMEAFKAQMSEQEQQMRANIEQLAILSIVYSYKDIDMDSLEKYFKFIERPNNRQFNDSVINGMKYALNQSIKKMAKSLAVTFKKHAEEFNK